MPFKRPAFVASEFTQQEPSLTENLSLMDRQLTQLEAELGTFAGTNAYPDWYVQEAAQSGLIRQELKDPTVDPEAVSQYFSLRHRQHQIHSAVYGHDDNVSMFSSVCFELGTDVVARGFNAEDADGVIHAALADRLEGGASTGGYVVPELEFLRDNYGLEKVTDLMGLKANDSYSRRLKSLLVNKNTVKWMRFTDEKKPGPGDDFEVNRANSREWMSGALSSAIGITTAEANNFVFAASRRTEDADFMTILDRFDHFGVERLRGIAANTGIHAFEDYSVKQLELMERLFQNPQEAAEELAEHDVNVVMVNRVGDYSGVMRNAAADYEDGNSRTLFFEIRSLADIYRNMSTLYKMSIKSSTLVLAAHSAPGQFVVSDIREPNLRRYDIATVAGRNLVRQVNGSEDLAEGETGYSMHGMRGMARLVSEYMQPSRAIDDDSSDRGRVKIIFQACHLGEKVEVKDADDKGVKFVLEMDSLIGRLGNDLAVNGANTEIDIYGASTGIQIHKTARGIRYSSQPKSFGEERVPLHAVRMRVQNGQVTEQNVDEIVLHKAA